VDDITMPDEDDVASQPPIELLRQLIDHQVSIFVKLKFGRKVFGPIYIHISIYIPIS
jgi:hypothetical protein